LNGQLSRLPFAFFASGAAALLFEVLWFRAFGRVLGNTVWAATLVLAAFMLGIAIGGLLAARWAERIRNPARGFAVAEVVVAVSGTVLVWALPVLEAPIGRLLLPLADEPTVASTLRLILAMAAMLLPTIAMGMTLPMGVRVLAQQDTVRVLGTLYAANTLGACLAPMLAEYFLIGALGLRGTALIAAALNLVAAGLAFGLPAPAAAVRSAAPAVERGEARLLIAAALAGALALALEVVWFRLLVLYAPATDATFATLLMLMLAGIALGGVLAPALARFGLAWVAGSGSFAVALGYLLVGPAAASAAGRDVLVLAALLMMPAAALSGSLFTLLGAKLRGARENPQGAIGRLTCANTLGAAAGAALGGFALLPVLGMERSLFALAAGYVLLSLILVTRGAWTRMVAPAVAAGTLLLFPFGRMEQHLHNATATYKRVDGAVLAHVVQGPTTTLQVLRGDRFGEPARWRLVTDSYSMTGTTREAQRYMQLFAWLPASLHPEPRRALLISYGIGSTARALLDDPGIKQLTIVDLSPEILSVSRLVHGAQDPLSDPRVRLVVEDGRHFLRTRSEQFDIITAEPPPPAIAGVVNLYSREYFVALAERLAPGGLATYWLPMGQFEPRGARAVIAAFCDAFPDCTLWAGARLHWIIMGGREFRHRPSVQGLTRLWNEPRSLARMAANGLEHPAQLGATFLADAEQLRRWLADIAPVTDDHPKRLVSSRPTTSFADYFAFLEPGPAAERFRGSTWMQAHWPAEFVELAVQFYRVQQIVNLQLPQTPGEKMQYVDALLRETRLSIPVLWLLDSDMTEQDIVERKLAAGVQDPAFSYALGVRRLLEGDFAKAAALLAEAAAQDPERAGAVAAYAACRAGDGAKARMVKGSDLLPQSLRCWK
jgi:predicted membrane-bound spermidine synthase